MEERSPFHRFVGLGASCLLHVVVVGAAVAVGIDVAITREPTVLLAELVPALPPGPELPRPAVRPSAPRRASPRPEALTPPAPIATPRVEPAVEKVAVPEPMLVAETSALPAAPAPREPASATFTAASDVPRAAESSPPASRAPATGVTTALAVPGGVTQMAIPRGGYQVRPTYPTSARRLGIQGTTTLRIHVAADGRVSDVLVEQSAGHVDLDHAAMDAVKRWRFDPARRGTEAVGMWVLLPVEFRLNR